MIKRTKTKGGKEVKVTFVLPEDHPYAANAAVAGDFNDWDPATDRFKRRSNGDYSVSLTLDAGQRYRFRYVTEVLQWFNEDEADGYEPNKYGSSDCILLT